MTYVCGPTEFRFEYTNWFTYSRITPRIGHIHTFLPQKSKYTCIYRANVSKSTYIFTEQMSVKVLTYLHNKCQ